MTPTNSIARALQSVTSAAAHHHPIDAGAYGLLIQHCSDHRLRLPALQLHARLLLLSVPLSNFLSSKLLTFYSRSGHLPLALHIFHQIPSKSLFSFNSILIALSLHSPSPSLPSLRLLLSLPPSLKPDPFTLSSLLKSLSSLPPIKQLHAFALRHAFDADLFVANGLLAAYAKSHHFRSVRSLFDRMPKRDVVSWNSVISGYSHAGRYQDCIQLYHEMERSVTPNGVTVATILHACSQIGDLVTGMRVCEFATGIEMDVVVWNSVLGFYSKCGSLDYARSLFDEMPVRDEVSYNTMITGYMMYGLVDRAMELFDRMKNPVIATWNAVIAGLVQNGWHCNVFDLFRLMRDSGLKPNSVTLSSILPAVSFYSNLLGGKQVHCYAIRNDCDQNVYVATALIDAYSKAGFVSGARRVFDATRGRSLIIWTAIISAYSSHGDADAALFMFDRMLDAKIQPDPVTFTAVLAACAHTGAVDEARRVFNMTVEYEISPAVEQYACMVGVFSRRGLLKEAVDFISEMPFKPNAKVWGPLLNGAAVFRNVEIGRFVFEKLVEIEPENTGNYVVMANLYSGCGRWEEAEMVRERMRRIGLAKIPGCSWIETSSGLQVFVARDTSNGQSEEMFAVLEGLVGLMREEGYVCREEFDEENSC